MQCQPAALDWGFSPGLFPRDFGGDGQEDE